jgi:hypothetical protein
MRRRWWMRRRRLWRRMRWVTWEEPACSASASGWIPGAI